MLGTADISTLGEGADIGTVTGALSKLNSDTLKRVTGRVDYIGYNPELELFISIDGSYYPITFDFTREQLNKVKSRTEWKYIDLSSDDIYFQNDISTYTNELLKDATEIMVVPLVAGLPSSRGRMHLTNVDITDSGYYYSLDDGRYFRVYIREFNNVDGSFKYAIEYSAGLSDTIRLFGVLYR